MSKPNTMETVEGGKSRVRIAGYISLVLAILFFSGIFQKADSFMKFFDFTNVLGSFGKLGTLAEGGGTLASNFRGTGGVGVRDGWLFALTLTPAVMLALGVVKIVEDLDGLRAAEKLMTPLLKPMLGIPGICGLALVASLQSTDTGASMTKELYDRGEITEKERLIFAGGFQFSAGAVLTNYLSSGAALFTLLNVPIIVPLLIILVFKILATNVVRLYAVRFVKED
jgi:nucleoside recognition membrane protein YjiH